MNDPVFSIITPVYNGASTIAGTIESVLDQLYPAGEYYIIDGRSTDNTVETARRYADRFRDKGIRYEIISEPDNGIYDAMNKGIRLSTGELVGIINSDDWYEKDALAAMKALYEKTGFDMAYADIRMHNGDRTFIKKAKNPSFVSTRYWNHPTQFVRRSLYDEKLYDGSTVFGDLDFLLWLHARGSRIETTDRVLANFTMGGASNDQKELRQVIGRIRIKKEIYRRYGYGWIYSLDVTAIELAKLLLGKKKKG